MVVDKVKPGTGPIWLDNVKCKGTENTLTECTEAADWGRSNCKHDKDVYIKCDKEEKKEEQSMIAHKIRISEILPWDKNLILPMQSYPGPVITIPP